MRDKAVFTKILATLGTVLVWLPVLAPVFFTAARLIRGGDFQFDFLMPAELFPMVLLGGALLLWAVLRQRKYRALVGWSLGSAVALLMIGSVLATLTGLADGRTEPGGWESALVTGIFIAFFLAVATIGIGGALLLRNLFKASPAQG